jgi:hypothetical protein
MNYKEPAYDIIESDPETVKLYLKLVPKEELEGKTKKEKYDLAKKKMKEYRVPPPNDKRGGKKNKKTNRKFTKIRKQKRKKTKKKKHKKN